MLLTIENKYHRTHCMILNQEIQQSSSYEDDLLGNPSEAVASDLDLDENQENKLLGEDNRNQTQAKTSSRPSSDEAVIKMLMVKNLKRVKKMMRVEKEVITVMMVKKVRMVMKVKKEMRIVMKTTD